MKDKLFYKIVRPIVILLIKILYPYRVLGLDNIPREGRILLAGDHTKWLDPVTLVCVVKRQIHFLAKEELFHGLTKGIVKGMGCIPVNRKIHDKDALHGAIDYLNSDLCVGIFPEGTINRTEDIILPFKIGAVKACSETNTKLIPFVITGNYKLFRKGIKIEFLEPMIISNDLEKANQELMNKISDKLKEAKDGS